MKPLNYLDTPTYCLVQKRNKANKEKRLAYLRDLLVQKAKLTESSKIFCCCALFRLRLRPPTLPSITHGHLITIKRATVSF